jgi:hypothetical protein
MNTTVLSALLAMALLAEPGCYETSGPGSPDLDTETTPDPPSDPPSDPPVEDWACDEAVVAVEQDGTIAAQSPAIVKGQGSRYAGEKVPMILSGKVDLKDGEGKSIKGAADTILMAAQGLIARILKEFEAQ